jgi:protein-tyrosine phosphatase
MKTILFVCTGNTCRSPMAVGLLKNALNIRKNKDIQIISAGVIASNGLPASPNAIKVMAEKGIDISDHKTLSLTKDIIERSDLIFVMTQWHKLEVIGLLERPGKQVYLIKEFVPRNLSVVNDLEVPDPIGKSIEFYRHARDEIEKCIDGIIKKVLENQ